MLYGKFVFNLIFSIICSVGLVYLMYRAFDQVCIHKPNTSRPANSERYLVCKGLKEGAKSIRDYMFKINQKLNKVNF